MSSVPKLESYQIARSQIDALLTGSKDPIAAMASVAAVLFENLPFVSWAGFYRVVEPELLRIGPYQGPVGCQEIPFGQGVCGTAAQERKTMVVADVHSFPGHIACDTQSLSEIVVPVFDCDDTVVAVLDLDSRQPANFDELDRSHLEQIVLQLRNFFNRAESQV